MSDEKKRLFIELGTWIMGISAFLCFLPMVEAVFSAIWELLANGVVDMVKAAYKACLFGGFFSFYIWMKNYKF